MALRIKTFLQKITLEPLVCIYMLAKLLTIGNQLETNLMIWKICHLQLNYTEDICKNLSADANEDIENQVQRELQSFEMIGQWIDTLPAFIYSFFIGALSDRFGRKPLILLPVLGSVIDAVLHLINYTFIRELPMEFFYLIAMYKYLGGTPIFYLGVYAYAIEISKENQKATTIARYDGIESIGSMVGAALSPIIFGTLGFYGSFSISLALMAICVLYMLFNVKESNKKAEKMSFSCSTQSFFNIFVAPLVELWRAISKPRPQGRRNLILLQIVSYAAFWTIGGDTSLRYVYMLKRFPGFNGTSFSHLILFFNIKDIVALLVIMPIVSQKLQIHEALLSTIALIGQSLGYFFAPFATELWQFYLCHCLWIMSFCKYALARALMSKCVEEDELGKIFSGMTIMVAFIPFATNPIYRKVYSATLEIFPGLYMFMSSFSLFIAGLINFYLYTQRHRMNLKDEGDQQRQQQQEQHEMSLGDSIL